MILLGSALYPAETLIAPLYSLQAHFCRHYSSGGGGACDAQRFQLVHIKSQGEQPRLYLSKKRFLLISYLSWVSMQVNGFFVPFRSI